ncbi:hypothetical protein EAM01S_03_02180 [Erwinia amylovora NBRC 12687 = CFBP 1232]|nr:hypothetical protein AD997_10945 [Erwinia amylovora]RUT16873.1 hypothetical protein BEI72_00515 [Erwinia amylovora]GAJ88045.1 hypothetical protein EAM01S_03_02180 [Erwinia amylovora NBRC 12687 = CFBP 1232]
MLALSVINTLRVAVVPALARRNWICHRCAGKLVPVPRGPNLDVTWRWQTKVVAIDFTPCGCDLASA